METEGYFFVWKRASCFKPSARSILQVRSRAHPAIVAEIWPVDKPIASIQAAEEGDIVARSVEAEARAEPCVDKTTGEVTRPENPKTIEASPQVGGKVTDEQSKSPAHSPDHLDSTDKE